MTGVLLAMPLLVINMGGEMIYILQQRLEAQQIADDKSKKVLVDVARTMFSKKFLAELFKPQEMYSNHSTRQIFDRLAHSSIMRLNESSMEKLYDLMTMGFKYQVLSCSSADQLLHVTLNHLESVKGIVDSPTVTELIEDAVVHTIDTYGSLSNGDCILLKQQLARFFQDRRVKVSLFLQDGMQNLDGTMVLRMGGIVATGADIPGTIKYYDANGRETHRSQFQTPGSADCESNEGNGVTANTNGGCNLGYNLYSKTARKTTTSAEQLIAASKSASGTCGNELKSKATPPIPKLKSTAADELNLLADLLGAAVKDTEKESKPFKINLFPEDPFDGSKENTPSVPMIRIDATSDHKSMRSMMEELDLNEDVKSDAKKECEDDKDLLELMDSTKTD